MAHLEKFVHRLQSVSIFPNISHPFLFGLLSTLWCFSTLVNFYFMVSFNLKVILNIGKNDLIYRDIAPLTIAT